jgi:hypothetical protein
MTCGFTYNIRRNSHPGGEAPSGSGKPDRWDFTSPSFQLPDLSSYQRKMRWMFRRNFIARLHGVSAVDHCSVSKPLAANNDTINAREPFVLAAVLDTVLAISVAFGWLRPSWESR